MVLVQFSMDQEEQQNVCHAKNWYNFWQRCEVHFVWGMRCSVLIYHTKMTRWNQQIKSGKYKVHVKIMPMSFSLAVLIVYRYIHLFNPKEIWTKPCPYLFPVEKIFQNPSMAARLLVFSLSSFLICSFQYPITLVFYLQNLM